MTTPIHRVCNIGDISEVHYTLGIDYTRRHMTDLHWSHVEKAVSRTAFDAALSRELAAIRKEVERMLKRSTASTEIWQLHDFLSEKRGEVDRKYDYRYSVLISMFGRLLHEGWLSEADLAGLSADKLQLIQRSAAGWREVDP